MSSEQPNQNFRTYLAANPAVAILAVIALLALLAAVVLGVLLLRSENGAEVGEGTPTAVSTETGGTGIEAEAAGQSLVVGISESNTISVTLDVPVTLSLAGQTIPVKTQQIPFDGVWSPDTVQDSAVWVYGSIINYIIGLPNTAENRTLLEQLAPGDELVLNTRGGTQFKFSFSSRSTVPSTNQDVFAQNMPGITLVLLGGSGQERLVVNGRYIVSQAAETTSPIVELGETAQLDNMQITVNSVSYIPDRPEIPAGFAFFLVDYEVQNLDLTAVDSANLQFVLMDQVGNQYAINAVASQLGNNPVLTGFLNANQVVQASAGFQIPMGLNSENVTLLVSRRDTGAQLQVSLPFSGSGTAAAQGANISLVRAEVSSDLTSLILAGNITNLGERPLVIVEQDISLQGEDGATYLLLSTNPPFPWTIPPGQTLQYTFAYQRPLTTSAVFTLLNQPFQLTNLR